MILNRLRLAWVLPLLVATLAGCAGWKRKPGVPDVAPIREERAQTVFNSFEQHRDDAQYQAALACWNQGNPQGCRELLVKLLERNPDHRDSQLLMVELSLMDNDLDQAVKQMRSLAGRYPDNAQVIYTMGLVHEAAGDDVEAVDCFRRAAQLEPTNRLYAASRAESDVPTAKPLPDREFPTPSPTVRNAHAGLLRAEVCLRLDRPAEAVGLLRAVRELQPDDAETQHMLGRALEAAGRPDEALACYQRAVKIEPDNHVYTVSDQRAAAEDHGSEKAAPPAELPSAALAAAENSESSVSSAPPAGPAKLSAQQWLRRADAALLTGAVERAHEHYRQALGAAGATEETATAAALFALRQEQSELALQLAEEALAKFPDSAALYRVVGTAHYGLGHWRAAQVALSQALALDKSHALSYFLMGCTLRKLGQLDEAEGYLTQARQLDARYALQN